MSESQAWRELLAEIIKDSPERERIAGALGVNPLTLLRWARNESNPRESHIQRLLEVVPKLRPLMGESLNSSSIPAKAPPSAIPVAFYRHVLDLYAIVSEDERFWSICTAILQEVLHHLASDDVDLDVSVVSCLAPSEGNIVRCLREQVGMSVSQRKVNMEQRARLFGAESLAGYVVETCRQIVIADLSKEQRYPYQLPEQACSAVATPIFHTGRIAGCLLAVCTTPDYFHFPELLNLLQTYAALLALAFNPVDFYDHSSIHLGIMPSLEVQASYFTTFTQRVNSLLKKPAADQSFLNYSQAEQRAWWQIVEELLRVPPRLSPET